ncbi:MAG: enoyl-CoA hydratase/isomerase family protein [Bacteroidetes bacterium]|nr:enoyl-CoA hydratase/isomerase family protein [Bacteroidota bacterium]
METEKIVKVDITQRVATLELNRPGQDNALDYALIRELKEALAAAETDPRVKVIVLTGHGDAFCGGMDIHHLQDLQPRPLEDQLLDNGHLAELFLRIRRHKKPVIAQVCGKALGGGCTLAMMCDFVLADDTAQMGYTDVCWGFVPALEVALLPARLAPAVMRRVLLSGRVFAAEEARALGMIDQLVPAGQLAEVTREFARQLCVTHSPGTLELLKRLLADVPDMPANDALGFAARIGAHSRKTVEFEIGIQAWLDNKPVEW